MEILGEFATSKILQGRQLEGTDNRQEEAIVLFSMIHIRPALNLCILISQGSWGEIMKVTEE